MRRNAELITEKLNEAMAYLTKQESTLKPIMDRLEKIMKEKLSESELSFSEAFDMFCKLQQQYTDSILLMTKIKEIIEFK